MTRSTGLPALVAAVFLLPLASGCGLSERKVCAVYQLGASDAKQQLRGLLAQAFARGGSDMTWSNETTIDRLSNTRSPAWDGRFCLDNSDAPAGAVLEDHLCARIEYPLYPQILGETCDCPDDSELAQMNRTDAYWSRFTTLCEGLVALNDLDVDCSDPAAVIWSTYPPAGDSGDTGLDPNYGNNLYGGSWGQILADGFAEDGMPYQALECQDEEERDDDPRPSIFDSTTLDPARLRGALDVDIGGRLDADASMYRYEDWEGATACVVDADGGAACWRITPEFFYEDYEDVLVRYVGHDVTLEGLRDGPWTGVQVKQHQSVDEECGHESIVCLESDAGPSCWHGTFDGCAGNDGITLSPVSGIESLGSVLPAATHTLTRSSGTRGAICGLTDDNRVGCWGAADGVFKTSWEDGYYLVSEDQAASVLCAAHDDGFVDCWDVGALLLGYPSAETIGANAAGGGEDRIPISGRITDITQMGIEDGYMDSSMHVLCALKTTGDVECARYWFWPNYDEDQLWRNFDDTLLRVVTPSGLPSLSTIAMVTIKEGDDDGFADYGDEYKPMLCGLRTEGSQLSCWGPFENVAKLETGWETDLERELFTTSGVYSQVFRDDIQGASSWFVNEHNLVQFLTY